MWISCHCCSSVKHNGRFRHLPLNRLPSLFLRLFFPLYSFLQRRRQSSSQMLHPPSIRAAEAWVLLLRFFSSCILLMATYFSLADIDSYHLVAGAAPPKVLTLLLSSPNSSRQGPPHRRIPHNARMALYDDLLTNGYYTTHLRIGTPPQEFALIVDTGSSVTYVPCTNCESCGHHQDPNFQTDLSSTYKPVKCNFNCTCDESNDQCTYERQYAEMSSSSGVLGEDIIFFGEESTLDPQHVIFGCENEETGDLFSQHADGIMGLGRGHPSIMDQLVGKGVISDSFSLCYGGMGIGGVAMVLGGISSPADMVFSHSDPTRSPYYNIELKEIHVAGKPLHVAGKHGTVLDSGTTYAYLPEAAFVEFKNSIVKKLHSLKQIDCPDSNYNDTCFSDAGSDVFELSKFFPEVEMVFGNGQKLSLAPENYLFQSKVRGGYCLGVFQNENDATTLLGGIIVRNTLATYDCENQRIGFWKTNCSDLWEKLLSLQAPSSSPSDLHNDSTKGMSPALNPLGRRDGIVSGKFPIGIIWLDLMLSVKYFQLLPHVTELAQNLAHELKFDINQVHLLYATARGNGSLVMLAIFAPSSSEPITISTAKRIFFDLTGHHVKLPSKFGGYELVKWRVEPPSRRRWWQRHILILFIGAILVMVCSSSIYLARHIQRQKQQALGKYRPVDVFIPEQELQAL